MTRGLPIDISNPSRRMVSISTRQVQQAAARDGEGIACPSIGCDAQGDVPLQFAHQPVAQVAAGDDTCPSRPASGELLMPKIISSVGSSTSTRGKARRTVGVADRVADFDLLQADHGHDVAGRRPLRLPCGRACRTRAAR